MGLDIDLVRKRWITYDKINFEECDETVYDCNITHNLGKMASEAGLYHALWRPHLLIEGCPDFSDDHNAEWEYEQKQTIIAIDIIPHVRIGLSKLKNDPEHYKKFDSSNGWGLYKHFVPFVEGYLKALKENPGAVVRVSR